MELTLYRTTDADNVINKTLTDPLVFQIRLKRDTDLVSPTLNLVGDIGVLRTYNYATIPALGRMYFVRNVQALNAQIISLECECDYLETYRDGIISSEASYSKVISEGDYGSTNFTTTGRMEIGTISSSVELPAADNAIFSVVGVS